MTLAMKIDVKGLAEIRRKLKQLPAAVAQKELIAGLRKGANVWRDVARANATSERVRKNIYVQKVKPLPGLTATVMVRVRKLKDRQIAKFKRESGMSARHNLKDPFFWRFLEFGTSKMAARPFLRPAFEAAKQRAVNIAIPHFRKRIEAVLRRGKA